tara:strand:+ start:33 stop:368 length:336 start_codon:yes stop_codon:yes gene_type:complete
MTKKNKVYWDDQCYICSLSIEFLKNKYSNSNIEFIKISSLDNMSNYMNEVKGIFSEKKTLGPDTIRNIYSELGYYKFVIISRLPIIKQIFNISYKVFAYLLRPILPKRKIQ